MKAITLHLTNIDDPKSKRAIEQGATFDNIIVKHPYNFSTWQIRGQIRDNYASAGGTIKASFTFPPLEYITTTLNDGTQAQRTIIKPQLSATITRALDWVQSGMIQRERGELARPGVNCWVYDIELEEPGTNKIVRLLQGYVQILPEVTA